MIVWINGAFGAGKTTTARELIDLIPNSTLFDPELIGAGLTQLLPAKRLAEVGDFQDLPIWRRLVVDTAAAMLAELGGVLVVPMTLLRQDYRDEIFGGLASRRIAVRHVLLAPAETILRERIADREVPPDLPDGEIRVRQWSYDHIEPYHAALAGWLTADAHPVDTSALTPYEAAVRIAGAVSGGTVPVCDIVQTPEPTSETVAAGVLLFDEQDRVLLVDPTYKAGWEFPGGVVESGEAPARAGIREVAEETGIQLVDVPSLLVVDWEPPVPPAYGGLRLLYDGGRLDSDEARRMLLPGPELRAWRFVTEEEAAGLLPPVRYERLRWALRARERGAALYLEAGVPTG
ncbi:NUDIX hydrolase [Streptomyces phaeochromogenes]|uniref:NUDIX hydrolase n=1 Tax=Streptomyces phaeochromogenes TaxID=1923 RepID=UPI0006E23027|nr:NUDIX hydrolase [Streptomyces phaeochromogenes]MCX5598976.1 NUDIX domain-containing protein [Streptomyces phaeochromogenes]WRZ34190.1 NUDIX domain-containing protein [Streptomyces phaeochromogenes]WSJ03515.1 NUDIX domain-containing protein [Streptomyces phaeochromogenes]WSS98135.1 NUDIX domain-containing protein [Streptomyces phaeochromogenes]WSW12781.1 NUDIX domain-containing protein [Streptomyces phaeochromogenes]